MYTLSTIKLSDPANAEKIIGEVKDDTLRLECGSDATSSTVSEIAEKIIASGKQLKIQWDQCEDLKHWDWYNVCGETARKLYQAANVQSFAVSSRLVAQLFEAIYGLEQNKPIDYLPHWNDTNQNVNSIDAYRKRDQALANKQLRVLKLSSFYFLRSYQGLVAKVSSLEEITLTNCQFPKGPDLINALVSAPNLRKIEILGCKENLVTLPDSLPQTSPSVHLEKVTLTINDSSDITNLMKSWLEYLKLRGAVQISISSKMHAIEISKHSFKLNGSFKDPEDLKSILDLIPETVDEFSFTRDEEKFLLSEEKFEGWVLDTFLDWAEKNHRKVRALHLHNSAIDRERVTRLSNYIQQKGCCLHELDIDTRYVEPWSDDEHISLYGAISQSSSLVSFRYWGHLSKLEFSRYADTLLKNTRLITLELVSKNLYFNKEKNKQKSFTHPNFNEFTIKLGHIQSGITKTRDMEMPKKRNGALLKITLGGFSEMAWVKQHKPPLKLTDAIKRSIEIGEKLYSDCLLPLDLINNLSNKSALAGLMKLSPKGPAEEKKLKEIYDKGFSPYAPLDEEGNTALHLIGKAGWEEGARFFHARFPDFDLGYRNKKGEVPIILEVEASAKRTASRAELKANAPRAKRARASSEPSTLPLVPLDEEVEESSLPLSFEPEEELRAAVLAADPGWVGRVLYSSRVSRNKANTLQEQLDRDFSSSLVPKVAVVRALLAKRASLDDPMREIPLWSQTLDLLYSGKSREKTVALPGRAIHSELMISLGTVSSYFNDATDLEGNPVTAAITFVHSSERGRASTTIPLRSKPGEESYHLSNSEKMADFDLRRKALAARLKRGEDIEVAFNMPIQGATSSETLEKQAEEGVEVDYNFTASFHHGEQSLLSALEEGEFVDRALCDLISISEETSIKVYALVLEIFSPRYACSNCLRSIAGEINHSESPLRLKVVEELKSRGFRLPKKGGLRMAVRISSIRPYMGAPKEVRDHQSVLLDVNQEEPIVLQHDLLRGQASAFQFDSREKR